MSSEALAVGTRDVKGEAMRGTRRGRLARGTTYAAALVLALALAGDRGRAAVVPALIYGQDPLEVLELKVRPNVVVVLDTSGSMKWPLDFGGQVAGTPPNSGDHPRSKLLQAKNVLRRVVNDNQNKVSFLFGQYNQTINNNIVVKNTTASLKTSNVQNRFQYWTTDQKSPSMVSTALTIQNDRGGSGERGLQSWQLVHEEWKNFYYEEDIPGTNAICTATMPGITPTTPKFYRDGGPSGTAGTFAEDLRNAINGASCTPARPAGDTNGYNVTYTASTGLFTISRTSGNNSFQPLWRDAATRPRNIRGALNANTSATTANPGLSSGPFSTGTPFTLLYRAASGTYVSGAFGDAPYRGTTYLWTETVAGTTVQNYQLWAGRFFNGETIRVQSDGQVCGMTYPAAADRTNPPSFKVQQVNAGCGADTGAPVVFEWGGGYFTGSTELSCMGFNPRVPLVPCDLSSPSVTPAAPSQLQTISPWLEPEFPFDSTGMPANYQTATGYSEALDGTWTTTVVPPMALGGTKSYGATPIASSLANIKWIFANLWTTGGAAAFNPDPAYPLDAIRNHQDPKEKTIVVFVTDGDDTCAVGSTSYDSNALAAAWRAEQLYKPVEAGEPASSVDTYIIGYGGAFAGAEPARLNWIAWGGSGLGCPSVSNTTGACAATAGAPALTVSTTPPMFRTAATDIGTRWSVTGTTTDAINTVLKAKRATCSTCRDALIAPDSETLARQLQAIIDQGAQEGDFTAAQSITESVFEYVDRASSGSNTYDARSPSTRYQAITPTRFITSFSLPGFNGQLRAIQNDGAGNPVFKWSAGEKLNSLVRAGFTGGICPSGNGASVNECMFRQLHGGVGSDPATSSAAIKRRIYTTDRNGLYDFTATSLMAGTANNRLSLWPPASTAITPADYTTLGSLDVALGLPDTTTQAQADFTALQSKYRACTGTGTTVPAGCTANLSNGTPDWPTRMMAARREAREMILAFMAGAKPVIGSTGIKRTGTSGAGVDRTQILYTYREWVLADSELATAAVVTQPLPAEPEATPYLAEYKLFRDGVRNGSGKNPDTAGDQIAMGFGLRNPDDDGTVPRGQNDTRTGLKPVMTVVYAPGNDMLHAFRAAPSVSPSDTCAGTDGTTMNATRDCGGEELWGFVPYDQLGALSLRYANDPQGRDNHVYMLARGVRFSDVFVPGDLTSVSVGGVIVPTMQGVWRRVLYFGRGIGGKYVTALDVTAPGPYTARRLATQGPIPLWSRGNPDTADGLPGGAANGTADEKDVHYRGMGQTWSIPVVAYVGGQTFYETARRSTRAGCTPTSGSGCPVDHVLFMGSGYGDTADEGTRFYTLDALTGDVVASVDVESVAGTYGLTRSPAPLDQKGQPYRNAIVANPAGFNPKVFSLLTTVHPAASQVTRVYVGDVYGRVWKFLTERPDVPIPVADLGVDQPVGTAASLLGMPPQPDTPQPYVFVTSGADGRQDGPFKIFGFWDKGDDAYADPPTTGEITLNGVRTFEPVLQQFNSVYAQGDPEQDCGYTEEAVFRGTVQPATAFECSAISSGSCTSPVGRVFFAGTRLSLPNTRFAPPTPLACSNQGEYPCRSQFDSIIYALGAQTGLAAYDLNAGTEDAYRVFRDSRLSAIQMLADPDPARGGSSFTPDEGQIKGNPKPPPPPGVPPSATTATANVLMIREPGQPPPAVRYGSTVCQQ